MTILEAERVRMPFGIHVGETLGEIAARDVSYFDYLLGISGMDTYLSEAVKVVAEKHDRHAKRRREDLGSAQGNLFGAH